MRSRSYWAWVKSFIFVPLCVCTFLRRERGRGAGRQGAASPAEGTGYTRDGAAGEWIGPPGDARKRLRLARSARCPRGCRTQSAMKPAVHGNDRTGLFVEDRSRRSATARSNRLKILPQLSPWRRAAHEHRLKPWRARRRRRWRGRRWRRRRFREKALDCCNRHGNSALCQCQHAQHRSGQETGTSVGKRGNLSGEEAARL